jgi:hypothetical protein
MNLLSRMSSGLGADSWYSCSVGMPLCEVQVDLAVFTLGRERDRAAAQQGWLSVACWLEVDRAGRQPKLTSAS